MLLFFQNLKNILKEKIQILIFIVLAILLATVSIGSWNVNSRLEESYNFMGQGTFNYNDLFQFGSKGKTVNGTTTVSPWFLFDDESHSIIVGTDQNKKTWTLPYLGIYNPNQIIPSGSLQPLPTGDNKYSVITDSSSKILQINDDNNPLKYIDNGLFEFDYNSPYFQKSAIGQLFNYKYNKDNNTYTATVKSKKDKILIIKYMNNFANSPYGQGIIQIINQYLANRKISPTINNIAAYVNPMSKSLSAPKWMTKDISSSNQADIDNLSNLKTAILNADSLNGEFSFLAIQNQSAPLQPNNVYNYFNPNQSVDSKSGQLIFPSSAGYYQNYYSGVLTANNLYDTSNEPDTNFLNNLEYINNHNIYIGPYYLASNYWQIVAQASNMKLEVNQQYTIWDTSSQKKLKIINWSNLVASNRLKIISKYPLFNPYKKNQEVNNSVYVVITPSYARQNNLHLGDNFKLANNQYLFVGAIGGDVTNIYPTIYDTDIFPDDKTDGIVYVSNSLYQSNLLFNQNEITDSSTVFITNVSGNLQDNSKKFINFLGADYKHLDNEMENNTIVQSKSDTGTVYRRYSLLGEVILIYKIVSIILFVIFILILFFTISVLLKKIMDKERVSNGILKANGYSNFKIGLSYTPYALLLTIIGVPIGWALGLIFETSIMSIFNNYFIIPNSFVFGWGAMGVLFAIVAVLSTVSILYTAIKQLHVSPLQLISPHSVVKTSKFLDKIMLKINFKNFWAKFNLTIFSVSYKQIIYFFLTFLAASVALTFASLLPTSINKVRYDYYQNLSYNNQYNYDNVVGNIPFSRYQVYNWQGPNGNNSNPLYPLVNNSLIPQYYKTADSKDWEKTSNIDSNHINYIMNMLISNLLSVKGASFSVGTLVSLINEYKNSNLTNQLYSLSCTFLPSLFHQQPITVYNPDPVQHIFTCVNKALSSFLPGQIKEQWGQNPISESQFNLTFGTVALDAQKEDLFTMLNTNVNSNSSKPIDIYGINKNNKTIIMNKNLQQQLNNSANLITNNQSNISSKKIPAVINVNVEKKYNLQPGQDFNSVINVPTLEYTYDGITYSPINASKWTYYEPNNNKSISLNNLDLTKFTLGNNNLQYGYSTNNGKTILPYYNLDNVRLSLPYNNQTINTKFVNSPGNSSVTGKILPGLLDTTGGNYISLKDNNFIISPYSGKYDIYPSTTAENATNWYSEALALGMLKVINVPKPITYHVIGVQNSYDTPRVFINQKLANDILGFPISQSLNSSNMWFNTKLSKYLAETDQTTRYNLSATNGSYSINNLVNSSNVFVPGISGTDYLGVKQQVINRVALISMILSAVFILVIILTAVIIIYIVTEGFVNKFLKFIAVMKALGYSNWEVSRFILIIFSPFVLLAWLLGIFSMWWIIKLGVLVFLNYTKIIIPFYFPWLLVPVTLVLIIIIFLTTFFMAKNKIVHMSIQQQVTSNEQ